MYNLFRNLTAVLVVILVGSLLAGGYGHNDLLTVTTVISFYAANVSAIFTVLAKAAGQRSPTQQKEKLTQE